MANQRILATEEMVGYGHATKADTLNRLTMVEHSEAGVHGAVARASMGTAPFVLGSDADGDMYYRASSKLARLAKGTAYQHLGVNSGATAPEWQASANSVLTAAGDILYASGANTLARLAKGAANTKLFMNAAGTAPEWASGATIKVHARAMTAASGDVSYTGYGFKPSVLFLLAGKGSTKIWSIGIACTTAGGIGTIVLAGQGGINADQIYNTSGYLCTLWESDVKYQLATVKSMDADGFTLTWTRSGTEPATLDANLLFLALR